MEVRSWRRFSWDADNSAETGRDDAAAARTSEETECRRGDSPRRWVAPGAARSSAETGIAQVPAPWLAEERNRTKEPEVSVPAFMCGDAGLGDVDRSHDQVQGWAEQGGDEVWIVQDEDEAGMAYVDLLRNPEGYTGYDGEPARRVRRPGGIAPVGLGFLS